MDRHPVQTLAAHDQVRELSVVVRGDEQKCVVIVVEPLKLVQVRGHVHRPAVAKLLPQPLRPLLCGRVGQH